MVNDAQAQTKKSETVTSINTSSPVFFFIYEGPEGEDGNGAIELQIHDRQHQFVSMQYSRLADQAKGDDPRNPWIKLINIPEINPRAFKQVETMEERLLAVDGVTVILVRLNKLREAARIMYQ